MVDPDSLVPCPADRGHLTDQSLRHSEKGLNGLSERQISAAWSTTVREQAAIEAKALPFDDNSLQRAVLDHVRHQTRGRVDNLSVECHGHVITIRGEVTSYYLWQLGLSAARIASCRSGGSLLDYRVKVIS
jgi:hypothetical protein